MLTGPVDVSANQRAQLKSWVLIRSFILACLWLAFGYFIWHKELDLAWPWVLPYLLGLSLFNLLTYWRLKRSLPVTSTEFFTQLLIDIIALSLIFYGSGGANNPFISYFLVPICIAAASLQGYFALLISLISLFSYSLLLFFYIPLPILAPEHHSMSHKLNTHVLGMWINFFISAGLVTYFVVKMARDLANREALLKRKREDELRNEQLLAVATLAAGTAHELGTPLATIKLLLGELRSTYADDSELQQDLTLLQTQVGICSSTLRRLVTTAEYNKEGIVEESDLRSYCQSILDHWQLLRPEAKFTTAFAQYLAPQKVSFHPSIAQALINLLNNAANANPDNLHIDIRWDQQELCWQIWDRGPGVDPDLHQQLGNQRIQTTQQGLGMGLLISKASINRYGGSVGLIDRLSVDGIQGTVTQVNLPLRPNE